MPDPIPSPEVTPTMVPETEVTSRIEKARSEEKAKLYSEIQALQKKVQDAESLSTTQLTSVQSQLQEAQGQLALLTKAKTPTGDVDIKAVIADTAAMIRTELNTRHNAETAELKSRLDAMEKANLAQRLAAVRQEVIAAANGRIIPALVRGDSEEAIRQSAEEAKSEYEAIVTANAVTTPNAPVPPPPLNPRAVNGGNVLPPATGIDGFKGTRDPATFGRDRTALMADLKKRLG